MLQRSGGFLPPVHTNRRVGFGVFSVKPGCHSSGTIRNYLVYLPPAHRVKKTRGHNALRKTAIANKIAPKSAVHRPPKKRAHDRRSLLGNCHTERSFSSVYNSPT
jgi:hypothetical protein